MQTRFFSTICMIFCSFLLNSTISAQDIITRIDGKRIECKIIKLGEGQVVYVPFGLENPPEISIDMSLVNKVTFESGYVYRESNIKEAKVYLYDETFRNALKLSLLSSIGGTTKITYERLYDHKNSGEFSILIHGLGLNNDNWHARGVGFEIGHKFLMTRKGFTNSDNLNALAGFYFKPLVLLGHVSYDQEIYDYRTGTIKTSTAKSPYGALYINIGAQVVINDVFLIDLTFGVGPCVYGESSSGQGDSYSDGLIPVGGGHLVNESNFGINGDLKFGYAFGGKLDARKTLKKR